MPPMYVPARTHRLPRALLICTLLISAALLVGCGWAESAPFQQDTAILFWQDWTGDDAALLSDLLDNFTELHPNLTVIDTAVPAADLAAEFADRFGEGTEPDLVLADAAVAQQLIAQGLVKELSVLGVDPSLYNTAALSMVSDGDKLYALPFALSTQVLFYDKEQVPTPPETLADLRQLTTGSDIVMGLNTAFHDAYWGLRAFGGRSYDSEGRYALDQGALTNWLSVLTTIQGAAGFMLSGDQDHLRQQFIEHNIALYVGDASEVGALADALGDRLGIAPLPYGEGDEPAGPLLQAGVLLISANAGENETARALQLAQFLTNSQQQSLLAVSDTGRWAAVNTVYLSPSMPDVVVQLATQLSSAVPVTLAQRPVWDQVAARAHTLYRGVLEGALDEQTAAGQLVAYADELNGRQSTVEQTTTCPSVTAGEPLTLTVWHSWSDAETAVLETLASNFHQLCPQVAISLTQTSNSTTLNQRFRAAAAVGGGPDVLIDSTQWTAQLAEAGLIRPLDNDLLPGELAAFIPAAVRTVQYDEMLYAYPESVRSVALIYNPKLVPTPPKTLHELLLVVDSQHALAMPLSFFYAYWGLGAFGAPIVDENGVLQLDQAGAGDWLRRLHDATRRPGFLFTTGRAEAESLFLNRNAAFLVSGPWSLSRLQAALPADEIAVAVLPSGPANRASPMLEVEGVMLNATLQEDATDAALDFARFLSSAPSAEALLATGVHVPANVTVSLADAPLVDVFGEQAQMAAAVIQDSRWLHVFDLGDELYRSTVLGEADIPTAVADFAEAIQRAVKTSR